MEAWHEEPDISGEEWECEGELGKSQCGSSREGCDNPASATTTIKPNWWGFLKLEAVKKLIELLRRQGVFSFNGIKRAMRSFIASRPDLEDAQLGMQKASGLEVGEICREDMCRHGNLQLPMGDSVLSAEMMEVQHCKSCAVCGRVGRVVCHCYFYKMLICISHR